MKNILLILSLGAALLMGPVETIAQANFNDLMLSSTGAERDTLVTSSSAGTVYLWIEGTSDATAKRLRDTYAMDILIRADSLAGSTNASAYIQYCYDAACTTPWNADTLTVNGASPLYLRWRDDNFKALYARVALTAGSTTQTTLLRATAAYRKIR